MGDNLPNLAILAALAGHVRPHDDGRWPLLPAYADPRGNLAVWCHWCGRWHHLTVGAAAIGWPTASTRPAPTTARATSLVESAR